MTVPWYRNTLFWYWLPEKSKSKRSRYRSIAEFRNVVVGKIVNGGHVVDEVGSLVVKKYSRPQSVRFEKLVPHEWGVIGGIRLFWIMVRVAGFPLVRGLLVAETLFEPVAYQHFLPVLVGLLVGQSSDFHFDTGWMSGVSTRQFFDILYWRFLYCTVILAAWFQFRSVFFLKLVYNFSQILGNFWKTFLQKINLTV